MLDPIIEQKMDLIAEKIFGTHQDPKQIPITKESGERLEKLTPNWIKYRLDKDGNPVAWVVVVPTTKEIATKFIRGDITEKQILDLTTHQEKYSALYICSAVTIPEYRRKGFASELVKEVIKDIPTSSDCIFFAWPFTEEGGKMVQKLEELLGVKIEIKQ